MIDFRVFWGKARPSEGVDLPMHPAAWHGLDVAAVLGELLKSWPELKRAIFAAFSEESEDIVPALLVLAALHDAGKFAPYFQAKVPELVPACLGNVGDNRSAFHDRIGLALAAHDGPLQPLIGEIFALDEVGQGLILAAVFGHHGRPVEPQNMVDVAMRGRHGPAVQAVRDFGDAVHTLMGQPRLPPMKDNAQYALSWRLAGAIALADWIGSDQRHFRYEAPEWTMDEYWERFAKPRARRAVRQSGLMPNRVATEAISGRLLPPTIRLSDAQRWAAETDVSDKGLFLIEDVMGSGKTEAALILAHRLMQANRASGLYLALPTMATANALYRRIGKFYRALFAAEARPSLILAHGARDLDETFLGSIEVGDLATQDEGYDAVERETGSAACTRWLADDRRKAFLADVGVGTVDQALLAILPVKHACVRQIGLSRRVLVIDEAHSFDFYVQRAIEELIAHQARLGTPVIVLSATLPSSIRERLLAAYARGAGLTVARLASDAYPLATAVSATASETPLAPRADLCRAVAIRRLDTPEAAEALVAEAARAGAAVAYLRNTVDDALKSFSRLKAAGLDVELFHARFAMGDRIPIEHRIVDRFGKNGSTEERRGRVLVATQVVEQSIDLDFDLLVTDLAPLDLILQRMGRMWRHLREGRGWPRPEIAVVSPMPVPDPPADWFSAVFPRARWVYQDHALLWRSARLLFERETIHVPEDMRALVEQAYDKGALDSAPPELQRSGWEAEGKAKAWRGQAALNVLRFAEGYTPGSGAWEPDIETPTRLGDKRKILRVCLWEGGCLRPWCDDANENRAWALSEISVRAARVTGRAGLSPQIEAAAAALDARWAERGMPATTMPLTAVSEGWSVPVAPSTDAHRAFYHREFGLTWKTLEGQEWA